MMGDHMRDEDRKDSTEALLSVVGVGAAAGGDAGSGGGGDGVEALGMQSPGSKLAEATNSNKGGATVAMPDRESVLLQVPAWGSYVR